MRRTFAVAAGIGAIAAVSMALVVPSGAGAAQTTSTTIAATAPGFVGAMCDRLPGLQATAGTSLGTATSNFTSANELVAAKRAAMTLAMTEMATAIVNHQIALDTKGPTEFTGTVLKVRQQQYVESVVAWSKARSAAYDSEQTLVFGQLQNTLLETLKTQAACP